MNFRADRAVPGLKPCARRQGQWHRWAWMGLLAIAWPLPLQAHPTPFSYADIHVAPGAIGLTVTAHIVDVAHELGIDNPDSLWGQPSAPAIENLGLALEGRLKLRMADARLTCRPSGPTESLPDAQSFRWSFSCIGPTRRGETVAMDGPLFPYDPEHHTFVNVYLDGALRAQADVVGAVRSHELDLTSHTPLDTVQAFVAAGVRHILSGPDHLLFLVALLLVGGSLKRLLTIVTAFTLAHSVTLAAAVLGIVTPPASVIEPLIALSIVAVGLENLRRSPGLDRRAAAAGTFGLIHGFGFASVLQEMQLRHGDLFWSLASFNLGVELGQVAVVACVAWLFIQLRQLGPRADRRLVFWGSSLVIGAGGFWFVERVTSALGAAF